MRGRTQLLHEELTYKIRGILYKTQNEIGNYRNEKQYADRIELELNNAGMRYEREKVLPKSFEGEKMGYQNFIRKSVNPYYPYYPYYPYIRNVWLKRQKKRQK